MNPLKKTSFCAGLLCVSLGMLAAANQSHSQEPGTDLSKPPTPSMAAALLEKGPGEASQILWSALEQGYQPGRGTGGGSARNEAFRSWLSLAEWFTLLAKTDQEEFARFLSPYLAYGEKDGRSVLFWRPPDAPFEDGMEPLPDAERSEIAADASPRETYLSRYIPANFQWQDGILLDYLGADLAAEITGDPARMSELLGLLSPMDFTPAVFQNLRRLHSHNAENFRNYPSLAFALAVVFDQLPPPNWPHHQVSRASLPEDKQTIEERFDFWVASHTGKKLAADPQRLGADQLKFVVDALVPAGELQYAQDRLRFARTGFEKAYSSIRYTQDRIKQQQYSWPEDLPYTLAQIQKTGGICVDQAYFAMIAGKAKGIPTLYFTGQGADGGHAWFGFLRNDTQWNMDAGRYENQNYAVGAALDPQTWERITDHELKFLGGRMWRTPEFLAGKADLAMAHRFLESGNKSSALDAATSAIQASPKNPAAWDLKYDLLVAGAEPFAKVRPFLEEAAKNFSNEPDLRTHYSKLLVGAARAAGDEKLAADVERRLISQNAGRRSDLSVDTASDRITTLLAEGKTDEALRDFRSRVTRLGRAGGGNFFYEVVSPLVQHLIANGDTREAARVLDQARRAMRPERGQILDQEFTALEELCKR